MTTALHPQTNGQTERTNMTLEEYLRHYLDKTKTSWVSYLPMAQFAFNSSHHEAIHMTPFYANYGREPRIYHQPAERGLTDSLHAEEIADLHQQLKTDLEFVTLRM